MCLLCPSCYRGLSSTFFPVTQMRGHYGETRMWTIKWTHLMSSWIERYIIGSQKLLLKLCPNCSDDNTDWGEIWFDLAWWVKNGREKLHKVFFFTWWSQATNHCANVSPTTAIMKKCTNFSPSPSKMATSALWRVWWRTVKSLFFQVFLAHINKNEKSILISLTEMLSDRFYQWSTMMSLFAHEQSNISNP